MIKSKRNFIAALFGTAAIVPTLRYPTPANVYAHLKCCWSWYETKDILNATPTRKSGISSRSDASFTVLSDSLHRDLIRLNHVAARIWELCDGTHSVDAMVRRVTVEYDVSPRVCATDVMLALTAFKRKGLISC
ncbi:MAG: PqqD family protein [Syntrophales bacterium]